MTRPGFVLRGPVLGLSAQGGSGLEQLAKCVCARARVQMCASLCVCVYVHVHIFICMCL